MILSCLSQNTQLTETTNYTPSEQTFVHSSLQTEYETHFYFSSGVSRAAHFPLIPLKASQVTEFLWLSAVVCPDPLTDTVTVVSVALATLAAQGHGVGVVGDGVVRAARDQSCPVQHLFVGTHVLGQSTPEEQLLAVAVLQREEKCVVSLKHTGVRNIL